MMDDTIVPPATGTQQLLSLQELYIIGILRSIEYVEHQNSCFGSWRRDLC